MGGRSATGERKSFSASLRVRVEKVFRAEGRSEAESAVARRSPPVKIGRPEEKTKRTLFERSEAEFPSGDTAGGRAAGQADAVRDPTSLGTVE